MFAILRFPKMLVNMKTVLVNGETLHIQSLIVKPIDIRADSSGVATISYILFCEDRLTAICRMSQKLPLADVCNMELPITLGGFASLNYEALTFEEQLLFNGPRPLTDEEREIMGSGCLPPHIAAYLRN